MKTYIKALAYTLPENEITNEQLVKEFPEWSVDKIADKVGINTRFVASENETSSDLAIKAAEKLFLENPNIKEINNFFSVSNFEKKAGVLVFRIIPEPEFGNNELTETFAKFPKIP